MKTFSIAVGFFALALFSVSNSFAQKVKVEKIKGNKAIVVFSGAPMEVGQTYDLGGGGSSSSSSVRTGAGSRDRIIGLSASLSSLTTSSSAYTSMGATGRYGWNKGQIEYGILGEFSTSSYSSVTLTSFGGGGFFDYDLVANRPGVGMVYGFGGQAKILSTNNGTKSYMSWEILPGGSLKWFALPTTTCIRFDASYKYRNDMTDPSATTTSGIVVMAGLDHYF